MKHIIDCSADPHIPFGWEVVQHKRGPVFEWNPEKVDFHLSELQKNGHAIQGNDLRTELANTPVMNINVLDYLLENPQLIPGTWNGYFIFFWEPFIKTGSVTGLFVFYILMEIDGKQANTGLP